MIRENGGDMKETYGVPVEEIQEGIRHGVRKVNIDTDIRLAMTARDSQVPAENPSKFDPREYLKPAMLAAKAICVARYQQFGCAGMAVEDQAGAAAEDGGPLQERRAAADRELAVTNACGDLTRSRYIATTARPSSRSRAIPAPSSGRVTVNAPMTFGSSASSIITTMIGTAITPLITAAQNSALIGSIGEKSSATPPSVASAMIA